MDVLIVKTSSMGDVVHSLPAVTEAAGARSEVVFDWLVEETLVEIPGWHPAVARVLPVALRRWRRAPFSRHHRAEWRALARRLHEHRYDLVIDAQGLLKSAWLTRLARAPSCGYDWFSAREPLASRFYATRYRVSRDLPAVARTRMLFASALGYTPEGGPDCGLPHMAPDRRAYVVFLPGSSWPTKSWPERHWIALAGRLAGTGLPVRVVWGNDDEHARAERIACRAPGVRVEARAGLTRLRILLGAATAVVAVDTGLAHLARALGTPTVALYGPTDPRLTGVSGPGAASLATARACAPCRSRHCRFARRTAAADFPRCLAEVTPEQVAARLFAVMGRQ